MKGFILKPHEAQALAAGKPVVIWRTCKNQPEKGSRPHARIEMWKGSKRAVLCFHEDPSSDFFTIGEPSPFPVGVPLFGKETFFIDDYRFYPSGKLPKEIGDIQNILYRANGTCCQQLGECECGGKGAAWRSSTSMPEWASRITLTLSDVKVRRPCDVTGEEACDMLTEECRAKAPYMETKGVLADWHIRAFRKQFSLHHKTDWSLYHFTALAKPA